MTFEDALRAQGVYENVFTRGSQAGVTGLVVSAIAGSSALWVSLRRRKKGFPRDCQSIQRCAAPDPQGSGAQAGKAGQ
jgi:hypothetical protein